MSREAPPPRRARKSRSLTSALDDFAAEKKAGEPTEDSSARTMVLVAVVCVAGVVGGGFVLLGYAKFTAPPPPSEDEPKSKIAYVTMEEIKANAAKLAEANGAQMSRSSVRKDAPRANAKDGAAEMLDGVQARVHSVVLEREYRVGALIYRRRNPLLRINVGFQMSALGQTRSYDFEPDMFPLARMIDEVNRPYPQLENGFAGRFTGTLRFDKEEVFAFYFDPPIKARPLYLDIKHPATEPGHVFRFFIPAEMYNVNR